jgi:hypothetical protein
MSAHAELVDVRAAYEVLAMEKGTFFHAGPPVEWDQASGPMRGALIGAMLFEGLADTPERAAAALASGDRITLDPCHHHKSVGPVAGVVSRSMWIFELKDSVYGGTAYCSLMRASAGYCATAGMAPRSSRACTGCPRYSGRCCSRPFGHTGP